jgi:hypothetical protein
MAVTNLVEYSDVLYAVIRAFQTDAGSECFVIAYPNQQTLHDVIAARCIVAFGFSSREEAVGRLKDAVPAAAA